MTRRRKLIFPNNGQYFHTATYNVIRYLDKYGRKEKLNDFYIFIRVL